jgi:hypothetical protein
MKSSFLSVILYLHEFLSSIVLSRSPSSPFSSGVDECGITYANIHLVFIAFRTFSVGLVGEADAPTHLVQSKSLGLID